MRARDARFEEAWASHGGRVARIAATYEADREKARDLTQDIALALWRALPAWRGDGSLKAFIARIAHNRAISHVVKAKGEPRTAEIDDEMPSTAPLAEAVLMDNDQRARLVAAVRALPIAYAQVVSLVLEDFSTDEIAATLGLTPGNVAVRMTRAKIMLKHTLRSET